MNQRQPDRRRWRRIPYGREVVIYASMRRLSCRGRDLGAGGICVEPPRGATPAERLRLNIALNHGKTVAVEGQIVRKGAGDPGCWGIAFNRVPRVIRDQLLSFVDTEAPPEGRASTERGAETRYERERFKRSSRVATAATSHRDTEKRRPRGERSTPKISPDRWTARASTPTPDIPPRRVSGVMDTPSTREEREPPEEIKNRHERDTYGRRYKASQADRHRGVDEPAHEGGEKSLEALRRRHLEMARRESQPDDVDAED